MGAASDVVDALRDGETSDGKFWIAIAFIAGAVILLVVLICACYAWRRRKRQRALRRKLNDAVEPEGLWGTESTAPLAESRRRVRAGAFPMFPPALGAAPVGTERRVCADAS